MSRIASYQFTIKDLTELHPKLKELAGHEVLPHIIHSMQIRSDGFVFISIWKNNETKLDHAL